MTTINGSGVSGKGYHQFMEKGIVASMSRIEECGEKSPEGCDSINIHMETYASAKLYLSENGGVLYDPNIGI